MGSEVLDISKNPDNPLVAIVPPRELAEPEYREWIDEVEEIMASSDHTIDHKNVEEFDLQHTFTPGLYVRQFTMPAGTIVTSRIHMHEHPFIISKGKVSVYDGQKIVTYTAPYQGVTKVGTKRILYNHEETVWTTFHTTNETDPEKLEEVGLLVCSTFKEFDRIVRKEIEI